MEPNIRTRTTLTLFLSRLFGVWTFSNEFRFSIPLFFYSLLLLLVNFILLLVWLYASKIIKNFELNGSLFLIIHLVNSATAAICVFKSFSVNIRELFGEKQTLFDEKLFKSMTCFLSVLALIAVDIALEPRSDFIFQLENFVYYVPFTQILCTSLQFSVLIDTVSSSFRSTIKKLKTDLELNSNLEYYLTSYHQLHKLAKLINEVYSLQIFLTIVRAFIVSTGGLYYFTLAVLGHYPRDIRIKKLFLSSSSVLTQFYFIKIIVEPCDKVIRDAKTFNTVLWERASESNLIGTGGKLINHFLVKRKVNFNAEGYVVLDNSLLCSITATITTYMVIFLQFGINNNNTFNEDPLSPSFYG